MTRARILIADDEPMIRSALKDFLVDQPWDVEVVSDGREALAHLKKGKFDVAVLDIRMPHIDGFGVLDAVSIKRVPTDILILTAFGSVPRAVEAIQKGAKDFMQKPVKKEEFVEKLTAMISARQPLSTHVMADRVDAFLIANLTRKDLTQKVVVDHFCLSRSYIWKLFRDMGSTFTERLAHHRTEKAKGMLIKTNEPIYVIAELCGFKNQSRLSEVFFRVIGESPTRFRQRSRADF